MDLTEAEHEALFSELEYLAAESEAILAERGGFVLPQRNDGKGPDDKPGSGCDDKAADCAFDAVITSGALGATHGLQVFVGMGLILGARCVCRHCKGYEPVRTACEAVGQ
jgi:hypothetical protein